VCLCVSQDAAHEISPSSDKNSASESIYTGPSQIFSSEHSGRSGHGCAGHGCAGHGRAGHGCAGHGCAGHGCAGNGCAVHGCAGNGCGGHGCAGHGCAGHCVNEPDSACFGCADHGCAGHGCAGQWSWLCWSMVMVVLAMVVLVMVVLVMVTTTSVCVFLWRAHFRPRALYCANYASCAKCICAMPPQHDNWACLIYIYCMQPTVLAVLCSHWGQQGIDSCILILCILLPILKILLDIDRYANLMTYQLSRFYSFRPSFSLSL